MTIKLNVQDVVSELEVQDETTVYLNKNTGEFVLVTDELAGALDRDMEDVPEWERDLLPKVKFTPGKAGGLSSVSPSKGPKLAPP